MSASFVLNDEKVEYHYAGEFSPLRLIEKIDEELVKIEEAQR